MLNIQIYEQTIDEWMINVSKYVEHHLMGQSSRTWCGLSPGEGHFMLRCDKLLKQFNYRSKFTSALIMAKGWMLGDCMYVIWDDMTTICDRKGEVTYYDTSIIKINIYT